MQVITKVPLHPIMSASKKARPGYTETGLHEKATLNGESLSCSWLYALSLAHHAYFGLREDGVRGDNAHQPVQSVVIQIDIPIVALW